MEKMRIGLVDAYGACANALAAQLRKIPTVREVACFSDGRAALLQPTQMFSMVLIRLEEAAPEKAFCLAQQLLEEEVTASVAFIRSAPLLWGEEQEERDERLREKADPLFALDIMNLPVSQERLEDLLERLALFLAAPEKAQCVRRRDMPMSTPQFVVRVKREKDGLIGTIFNPFCARSYAFHDFSEMLILIDQMCEYLQYPQRQAARRSFFGRRGERPERTIFHEDPFRLYVPREAAHQLHTEIRFEIRVSFREHGSLQGSILWNQKGMTARRQTFISALQLLYLAEEAVCGEERLKIEA